MANNTVFDDAYKTQIYSLEEILKKKLYLLLPFYLLRYEKETKQIEEDENKLGEIVEEYRSLNTLIRLKTI